MYHIYFKFMDLPKFKLISCNWFNNRDSLLKYFVTIFSSGSYSQRTENYTNYLADNVH